MQKDPMVNDPMQFNPMTLWIFDCSPVGCLSNPMTLQANIYHKKSISFEPYEEQSSIIGLLEKYLNFDRICSNQQLHPRYEWDPQDTLAKHLVRRYIDFVSLAPYWACRAVMLMFSNYGTGTSRFTRCGAFSVIRDRITPTDGLNPIVRIQPQDSYRISSLILDLVRIYLYI